MVYRYFDLKSVYRCYRQLLGISSARNTFFRRDPFRNLPACKIFFNGSRSGIRQKLPEAFWNAPISAIRTVPNFFFSPRDYILISGVYGDNTYCCFRLVNRFRIFLTRRSVVKRVQTCPSRLPPIKNRIITACCMYNIIIKYKGFCSRCRCYYNYKLT